jgi:hypothetical protein
LRTHAVKSFTSVTVVTDRGGARASLVFPAGCGEFVVPAKVPRRARDPEFIEGAGIQRKELDSPVTIEGQAIKRGMRAKERRRYAVGCGGVVYFGYASLPTLSNPEFPGYTLLVFRPFILYNTSEIAQVGA